MTTSPSETRWIPEFDFGDKVRKIRRAKGLTQGEFAQKLGVTASAASAWESAGARTPRDVVTIAKRIELAFGVPAAWLLGLDVELPTTPPDGGGVDNPTPNAVTNRYRDSVRDLRPLGPGASVPDLAGLGADAA